MAGTCPFSSWEHREPVFYFLFRLIGDTDIFSYLTDTDISSYLTDTDITDTDITDTDITDTDITDTDISSRATAQSNWTRAVQAVYVEGWDATYVPL